MTTETLTVVIKGRNLEPLRKGLAEDTVRCLRVFDGQEAMKPGDGEAVIESIRLMPENTPAEEIEKLETFKSALKRSGLTG